MEVFTLEPQYEWRIHRYAKDCFNDLIADIVQEVPQLAELDEDQIRKDVDTYLTDAEKIAFNQCWTDIKNCLQQCIDIVDNNRAYTYSIELIRAMYKLKGLFRTVYRRKAEKAEAEQREKEEKAEAERKKGEEQKREREERAQAERKKREEDEALRETRQKELEEQQRKEEAERREIFALKPEYEGRIHPRARKYLDEWRAKIAQEVPELAGLDKDQIRTDVGTYLTDDEKTRFNEYQTDVSKWLSECIDVTDNLSECLYRDSVIEPMVRLKYLIKTAYQRKAAKAEEEQRKREEEAEAKRKDKEAQERKREEQAQAERREREEQERWRAAYRAINPPVDDAEKYLDKPGEYDKFKEAVLDAIDVYLEKGEKYLDDHRTFDYRWLLDIINQRKDEERRKAIAQSQAQEYNKRLNSEVARLKRSLYPSEKDYSSYFRKQVNDARYTGYSFNHVLADEDKQAYHKCILSTATSELHKLVREDFRQFIDWECWRTYFLLPSAEYSFEGVPCLDFMLDVFAVVETRVWLKPGRESFSGYTFQFPWRGEEGHSILAREPEFLGYHYHILTPSDLSSHVFWQTVPLVLLRGLLSGEIKPAGTTITAASDGLITYKIPKFKEEVTIPNSFAEYVKKIGTIDGMLSMGIITEKVAGIIKSELGQLQSGQEPSSLEDEAKRQGSKKAMAVKLFNEGRRPGDPKVKGLGIKPNTAYRYYQDWKKAHYNSENPT